MDANAPPDIRGLQAQLDAAESDARNLVTGLSEERGAWRPAAPSWSVSECLDHLAAANRMYLRAMHGPATRARERGRWRVGPAMPGFVGRWFVNTLEPPVRARFKMKAPQSSQPRVAPSLADALRSFLASQDDVRQFVQANADLDLAGIRFPNPFVRGVRFSLATGLHAIAAHERRHLWQAWRVRQAVERAYPTEPETVATRVADLRI
jgi:hypothetical protein